MLWSGLGTSALFIQWQEEKKKTGRKIKAKISHLMTFNHVFTFSKTRFI